MNPFTKKNKTVKVFYDNDGNIDDMISLFMLLNTPNIDILGISFIPADSDLEVGLEANLKILSMTNKSIKLGFSKEKGKNPFPDHCTIFAYRALMIPTFLNTKAKEELVVKDKPACDFMAETILNCPDQVTVLLTGPPTNFILAIEKYPQLKTKIEKVVWMGGAVDVPGNNELETAELNAYWDPVSTKKLLTSKLNVVMFPLDATNQVPVNRKILEELAQQCNYDASNMSSQLFATIFFKNSYYMWDMLTTAYVGTNEYVQFRKLELDVIVDGKEEGKIIKTPGSGTFVKVADKIDLQKYYDYFFKVLQYNFNK